MSDTYDIYIPTGGTKIFRAAMDVFCSDIKARSYVIKRGTRLKITRSKGDNFSFEWRHGGTVLKDVVMSWSRIGAPYFLMCEDGETGVSNHPATKIFL